MKQSILNRDDNSSRSEQDLNIQSRHSPPNLFSYPPGNPDRYIVFILFTVRPHTSKEYSHGIKKRRYSR